MHLFTRFQNDSTLACVTSGLLLLCSEMEWTGMAMVNIYVSINAIELLNGVNEKEMPSMKATVVYCWLFIWLRQDIMALRDEEWEIYSFLSPSSATATQQRTASNHMKCITIMYCTVQCTHSIHSQLWFHFLNFSSRFSINEQ